jgi:hypothetical protein
MDTSSIRIDRGRDLSVPAHLQSKVVDEFLDKVGD